jgi:hypothetical protein
MSAKGLSRSKLRMKACQDLGGVKLRLWLRSATAGREPFDKFKAGSGHPTDSPRGLISPLVAAPGAWRGSGSIVSPKPRPSAEETYRGKCSTNAV